MVSWKNSMENQWMILPGVPHLFYQMLQKNLNPQKKTPKSLFQFSSKPFI
jgi:molybdopterin-biosynthesis enzyme MoeA-like protein